MSETPVRQRAQPADEDAARRAERGVVAGYIHEVSRRHEGGQAAEPGSRPAPEATEGA